MDSCLASECDVYLVPAQAVAEVTIRTVFPLSGCKLEFDFSGYVCACFGGLALFVLAALALFGGLAVLEAALAAAFAGVFVGHDRRGL
jgi:hypothetical protein